MSHTEQVEQFDALLQRDEPVLALAPMQDVTDLPFWSVIRSRGGADVYYTEYFRVHADSRLEKPILHSITKNPTGRPVVAQMIGNSIPDLVRTARELQQHPIAAVDLNLGCPAPVVYKKCAGGGLLREPERVDLILGALREAVETRFTVKTRIGFDDPAVFDELLPIFEKHDLDLLTVHGRTVKEMYRSAVHYDFITRAVAEPLPLCDSQACASRVSRAEAFGKRQTLLFVPLTLRSAVPLGINLDPKEYPRSHCDRPAHFGPHYLGWADRGLSASRKFI